MSSRFIKTKDYGESKSDKVNVSGCASDIIYVNDQGQECAPTIATGQIVYADTTEACTPQDLFDRIKNRVPDVVACGVTEDVFLELLKSQLAYFIAAGDRKWNFLSVKHKQALSECNTEYTLPSNYDQMIAVTFDPECPLAKQARKVELEYVDKEKSNFIKGVNFYTLDGYNIELIKPTHQMLAQNYCNLLKGYINLHYYTVPQMPKTMDEAISWFPNHIHAKEYLIEKMIEVLYQQTGQGAYVSPTAEVYFNNIKRWDSNFDRIQNKTSYNQRFLNYTPLMNRAKRRVKWGRI